MIEQYNPDVCKYPLFITKLRQVYSDTCPEPLTSSGLYNSARFVSEMLNGFEIPSHVVQVVDNNCIDRELTKYAQRKGHVPTHVFIEALWVVPSKFHVLTVLYPNTKWVVRIHSDAPFLSGEGMALDWIFEYLTHRNVYVAFNSRRKYKEMCRLVSWKQQGKLLYLPNYYPYDVDYDRPPAPAPLMYLNVGCFGAIRPLKNHLNQAYAAIRVAERLGCFLNFHINATRLEGGGAASGALRNLRALFAQAPSKRKLIEHGWLPHRQFLELMRTMHLSMQVSFSETFNIVTADAVVSRVPVVVSDEVSWVSGLYRANPTCVNDIAKHALRALRLPSLARCLNLRGLRRYSDVSSGIWLSYLNY